MSERTLLNGMELSKAYFHEYGESLLEQKFSQYKARMVVGLVGEGSECLGFDDAFSRDHILGQAFASGCQRTYIRRSVEICVRLMTGFPRRIKARPI